MLLVVAVQCRPGQADSFCRLVVACQPLHRGWGHAGGEGHGRICAYNVEKSFINAKTTK